MLTPEEKKQLNVDVETRVGAVEQMLLEECRTLDERQKDNGRRIHALREETQPLLKECMALISSHTTLIQELQAALATASVGDR